jgi:DNA-binding winged helix-turn-helix (wHTH) protein
MIYRFGDCEVDEARRVLRRGGRERPLQPKVLDLLLFLLRHRTRLVPKEMLFRELWPDAIVSEASLTRLVKEARRAIGDDGRRQRMIRTANRRGYRFAVDVEVRNGDAQGEEEWAVDLAQRSLEAAVEFDTLELRERVREFAETCRLAIASARRSEGAAR